MVGDKPGVWVLFNTEADWIYGVFSTSDKAIAWLRKSRRHWNDTEPIIPDWHQGRCARLSSKYQLRWEEIDPPEAKPYEGATAMS